METSYTIQASIVTTQTYLDMLSAALGYRETITQWNPETNIQEEIPNPETKVEFLTKQIKSILVNETTRPIQSMIYNQANMAASQQYEEIRTKADDSMEVVIEEVPEA